MQSLVLAAGLVAAIGLSSEASDSRLGTTLDLCGEGATSGLTIAAADQCVTVTGNVRFSYSAGNYRSGSSDTAKTDKSDETQPTD